MTFVLLPPIQPFADFRDYESFIAKRHVLVLALRGEVDRLLGHPMHGLLDIGVDHVGRIRLFRVVERGPAFHIGS